jgi:putative flippase GtrA
MIAVMLRWGKFNLVGALGMLVQFAALAALVRVWPGHALACSALAVEMAVLHNFVWHVRYTWRDRPGGGLGQRLLRFHLANGLVSVAGNVVVIAGLQALRVPLAVATLVAIGCCSVVNFRLGDRWAFAEG